MLMTPEVQLCTPDDTLKDAAQAMAALGVGLLPVTDNERLVGTISDRDIAVRGVGMSRGPEARVGDVMTADVKYCYEDQDLDEVMTNMGDIQVRRLPVLGRDKRLVGIIALGDIALIKGGNGTGAALSRMRGQAGNTRRFSTPVDRARQLHSVAQRSRDVQNLLLKAIVVIQRLMRRGVGLHVTDITLGLGHTARRDQRHLCQPICD